MNHSVPTIAAVLAVALLQSTMPASAGPNGECTCRYKGQDVAEGQTACLSTPQGMQLARCDMVLNNTSWRFLGQPCPTAQLPASNTAPDQHS